MLKVWEDENLFKQIVEKNKDGKRFRFLDGPITANYRMGVHHIWGRTLKDVAIKYNAMQGKSCQYQNGFDAQGMWVEVNVEKELGLNGKPEIMKYGLDKFTSKCMERVDYFANEMTNQSKRMGQFMDWENSYFTNSDHNITSIWAFLKLCSEKGWIVKKHRPMVWCPRCGTSISEHEMLGSYKDVKHEAIYVKLPVKGKDFKIVAWTTTPWTLSANVALAVNPKLVYAKINYNNEFLVMGKDALKNIIKDENKYTIVGEFLGSELEGLEYETCFPELKIQNFTHRIVPWADVDATSGSCVVHIAPGCGAEDFDLGLVHNLPQICPIDDGGIMLGDFGFMAGKSTSDVTPLVVEDLKKNNKLLYSHQHKHSYPFCWRCKTDLVYKLVSTWYIKIDELRPLLLKAIEPVKFYPEFGKKRMIDWLTNMGDWNISRSRFYGLPLPFYVCEKCGKLHVVGSLEELKKRATDPSLVDKLPNLHRPWIDDIRIKCDCGSELERVPEVGDCWLDAGITPFSTKKYFTDKEYFNANFPSEFVCEMVEQLKLWFYSTLVMSVVITGKAPYEKICTYQYVTDENGKEFHKSGGNSLDCDHVADRLGAEAVRYQYAGANTSNDVRFGDHLANEASRKIMAFWNTYIFFNTYAVLDNPKLENYTPKNLSLIDKWLTAKNAEFINVATTAYESYSFDKVVAEFERYVDDISNFYIRANRKRFWNSNTEDQLNAYYCLFQSLKTIVQIMAPILPFSCDYIWRNLVCAIETKEAPSVHLSNMPKANPAAVDTKLIEDVKKVKDIIYLGQKLRNEYRIKVKQPLSALLLKCDAEYKHAVENLKAIILDELNIKAIEYVESDQSFYDKKLTLNFKLAGAVFKADINKAKDALENMSTVDMQKLVELHTANKPLSLLGHKNLSPELFLLKITARPEFAVAELNNNLVAIDINLTPELIKEGRLREILRQIQVSRKDANFKIEDRIYIDLSTSDAELSKLISEFAETIKSESLALDLISFTDEEYKTTFEVNDATLTLKLKRATR